MNPEEAASTRVLSEMTWSRSFADRVRGVLPTAAFEERAAICAAVADHDARFPDAAPEGMERAVSLLAVLHHHALVLGQHRRDVALWQAAGRSGAEPVSPYRQVTRPLPGEPDLALLGRSLTMLTSGRVAEILSPADHITRIPAKDALDYLVAVNAAHERDARVRTVVEGPVNAGEGPSSISGPA